MKDYDVIVIGGGASGMMAAYVSASSGANTLLIEANDKLGKKMFITGKGRCNITNDSPVSTHIENTVHGGKFLQSAFSNFNSQDMLNFLASKGLKVKTEHGNRVFPESDKSSDVIKVLHNSNIDVGTIIHLNEKVIDVQYENNNYIVCTDINKYTTNSVIVATGGKTYSSTGSTGFGYSVAQKFGHKILNIAPALVPIVLKDYAGELEGLSLKNVAICCDKLRFTGEMLFTHNGISGPIVLTLSSYLSQSEVNGKIVCIDFKPALSIQQLLDRFAREFNDKQYCKKILSNYLKSVLPLRLVPVFSNKLSFATKRLSDINKEERIELANLLKKYPFIISRLDDLDFGIVTSGGVDLKEINPKTMESKLSPGLYFVGEVIDADALTGGFNLQIAYSTGVLAGQNASRRTK